MFINTTFLYKHFPFYLQRGIMVSPKMEVSEKEAMIIVELGLNNFFNWVRRLKDKPSSPKQKRVFKKNPFCISCLPFKALELTLETKWVSY